MFTPTYKNGLKSEINETNSREDDSDLFLLSS